MLWIKSLTSKDTDDDRGQKEIRIMLLETERTKTRMGAENLAELHRALYCMKQRTCKEVSLAI